MEPSTVAPPRSHQRVGPNTLKQDVSNTLEGGKTYEMTFTISAVTATTAGHFIPGADR